MDMKDSSLVRPIGRSRSGRELASQQNMGQDIIVVFGWVAVVIMNVIEMSLNEDGVKWDKVQKVATKYMACPK